MFKRSISTVAAIAAISGACATTATADAPSLKRANAHSAVQWYMAATDSANERSYVEVPARGARIGRRAFVFDTTTISNGGSSVTIVNKQVLVRLTRKGIVVRSLCH